MINIPWGPEGLDSNTSLLKIAITQSIISNPALVKVIRKNAWPVMIESDSLVEDNVINQLSKAYSIPAHVIAEVLSNAQMIGFLPGATKEISDETRQTHNGTIDEQLISLFVDKFVISSKEITQGDIEALDKFFTNLSQTNIIQSLQASWATKKEMPWGLIRQISLFDMDYKNTFSSIQQRLDFILLNIKEQERIFGQDYEVMIKENGWLPVDDIIGKETTMLSKDKYFGKITTIGYNDQKIDVLMRIVPGFSPVGLDVMFGLDLPWGNQNYFATIGVAFNNKNGSIIPSIHTIQLSSHNIGSNSNGELVWIKEPYDTNTISMKERMKIITQFANTIYDSEAMYEWLIELSETWLPAEIIECFDASLTKSLQSKVEVSNWFIRINAIGEDRKNIIQKMVRAVIEYTLRDGSSPLLIALIHYLFAHGYKEIQVQKPQKNLRLQQHNQYRTEKSIVSSGENLYIKKARQLWGIQNDDWDFSITAEGFFAAMANPIHGYAFLKTDQLTSSMNDVFEQGHVWRATAIDIKSQIDYDLVTAFINSPLYTSFSSSPSYS
jgi:hypothetical protein